MKLSCLEMLMLKYVISILLISFTNVQCVDLRIYNLTNKAIKIKLSNKNEDNLSCTRGIVEDLNGENQVPVYISIPVETNEVAPLEIVIESKGASSDNVIIQDLKKHEIIQVCGFLNWHIPLDRLYQLCLQDGVKEVSVAISENLMRYAYNFFISAID